MKNRFCLSFLIPGILIYSNLLFSQDFKQSSYVYNKINSPGRGGEDYPPSLVLEQNYPNPFNTSTMIFYASTRAGFVSVKVYDALGKLVTTFEEEYKEPGIYRLEFDGSKLSSGIYFCNVTTNGLSETKPMILMK